MEVPIEAKLASAEEFVNDLAKVLTHSNGSLPGGKAGYDRLRIPEIPPVYSVTDRNRFLEIDLADVEVFFEDTGKCTVQVREYQERVQPVVKQLLLEQFYAFDKVELTGSHVPQRIKTDSTEVPRLS
ncbi:MAG: hypothetical protein KJ600_03360 [Nanoarchaeota archaeon]|nr:hypothetical protein [Nanoarchaeota archaeon]MBU1103566.1 hypothetical protein [Nanoarchaeota archaeon]